MSKLLLGVLDKVSENNNEYRAELRTLNNKIDEATTALVGDIVTLSNYTVDFSNTIATAKENIVNKVSRIIETYVIKDLRSVESVNEQFLEKINDKIDSADISSDDDRNIFISNLNNLLNDKYLEIVKIKRIDFIDENGVNNDIEIILSEYLKGLLSTSNYDESKLVSLFNEYKSSLYIDIKKSLGKISDLYQNNFVTEVSKAIGGAVEITAKPSDDFKPYIPDINPVEPVTISELASVPEEVSEDNFVVQEPVSTFEMPTIPEIPKFEAPVIPKIPEAPVIPETPEIPVIPEMPKAPELPVIPEIPEVPNFDATLEPSPTLIEEQDIKIEPMIEAPIVPLETVEVSNEEAPKKSSYDVEEILRIAKSPVVAMPTEEQHEEAEYNYKTVKPINAVIENDLISAEFDEAEIVAEMISRLSIRLDEINKKERQLDEEKTQLDEDEKFVNDLIASSNAKKEELDKFDEELRTKSEELDKKENELSEKIKNVMPFANAVMEVDN